MIGRTPQAAGRGFTLVELLLVVVIIGIVTAVVVPQFGAGMSGTKLAVGARTLAQAGRYGRTMALLHQAETELVFGGADGRVVVKAAPSSGELRTVAVNGDEAFAEDSSAAAEPATEPPADAETGEAAPTNSPAAAVTAAAFADAIAAQYVCDGVTFRFMGYTDTEESILPPAREDAAPTAVRFRSNGTCRPFRVRVSIDEEQWLDVTFDMTGSGRVEAP